MNASNARMFSRFLLCYLVDTKYLLLSTALRPCLTVQQTMGRRCCIHRGLRVGQGCMMGHAWPMGEPSRGCAIEYGWAEGWKYRVGCGLWVGQVGDGPWHMGGPKWGWAIACGWADRWR
ncbi:hypothetical protein PAXRUDRAFT_419364 [Paxillus rubicundulus Ve08.2h10]|uniref:Uncharacterized protein n=1 Tax=Paxillus rubicundulus Ve08.2h10 TaxID=930991 RepID=A0A0D0CZE3_9AGAM|nr:hypothetical protein PAXRUDRAFT_419364 [Paxillus rubicundulus Ve08.2h10]